MRPLIAALAASLLALPAAAQAPAAAPAPATAPGPAAAPAPAPAPAPAVVKPAPKAVPRRTAEQRFDAANSTRDGKLTLAQAKAGKFDAVVKNFDAIDKDHKGYITKADIVAWRKANKGTTSGL